MRSKSNKLLPKLEGLLAQTGENIRLARLRRRLTVEQVCARAGISRATLWSIEKGSASVSMGAYLQVLFVLQLEKDVLKLAGDDPLGHKLLDLNLITPKRAPRKG